MKKTAARIALLVVGLSVGGLLAEVVVRVTGAARPAELDELFDRPPVTYSAAPARAHPWASGQEDSLRVAVVGDSFTVGEGNHG